ncbi:MAG: JmjC domain-containing protein [Burkholderiales bacterium]
MQLLGGLTAAQFLRRYWQKRPLLVRGAIPGFSDPLAPAQIKKLATRDDVESRLVWRDKGRWQLDRGPLPAKRLATMPSKNWTVLVQGTNLHADAADALLRRFAFLPAARLDDLMASFAAPGGGVGPHVDSYDVFLLQGQGRRRWRIGNQADHQVVASAPLAVLRNFTPNEEWVLNPGDMLYLPPHIAHEGVALDACITWSIGFRAPAARELGSALLDGLDQALHQQVTLDRYADPGLKPSTKTGAIPRDMLAYAINVAKRLRLTEKRVAAALGQYLSEPKASVSFDAPEAPLSSRRFVATLRTEGFRLDRCTQMLYRNGNFFINGEIEAADGADSRVLQVLADLRRLDAGVVLGVATHKLLYRWYVYGWLHCGASANALREPRRGRLAP